MIFDFPSMSPHVIKECLIGHINSRYSTAVFIFISPHFCPFQLTVPAYLKCDRKEQFCVNEVNQICCVSCSFENNPNFHSLIVTSFVVIEKGSFEFLFAINSHRYSIFSVSLQSKIRIPPIFSKLLFVK